MLEVPDESCCPAAQATFQKLGGMTLAQWRKFTEKLTLNWDEEGVEFNQDDEEGMGGLFLGEDAD